MSGLKASMFSAALCRGLIEAEKIQNPGPAAWKFSAALCRGLIEAAHLDIAFPVPNAFSAALCRGLIEADRAAHHRYDLLCVFRGFMPRPH